MFKEKPERQLKLSYQSYYDKVLAGTYKTKKTKGKMMTSKERVKLAFEHKEADRVPVGDVAIHPPASSKILGRDAMTGYSGLVARKQIKMILEGKRDEFIERYAVDTLELHRKLDLDLISVEICPPKKNNITYENLAEKSWSIVNSVAGTWSKYVFEEEADIILEVESNINLTGAVES